MIRSRTHGHTYNNAPPRGPIFGHFFIYMWGGFSSVFDEPSIEKVALTPIKRAQSSIHSFIHPSIHSIPERIIDKMRGDLRMVMCQARGGRDWLPKHVRQGPGRRALIMKVSEVGGPLDGFRPRVRDQGNGRNLWMGEVDGWIFFLFGSKGASPCVKEFSQLARGPPTFKVLMRFTSPNFGPSNVNKIKVDGS
jgi:hypothetical protein